MSLEMCLDYLGVRLNGETRGRPRIVLNLELTDTAERAVLELANGALSHSPDRHADDADATVRMERIVLDRLIGGHTSLAEAVDAGEVQAEPGTEPLEQLLELMDEFNLWFKIVEP